MQKLIFIANVFICAYLSFVSNLSCNAQRPGQHEIQVSYGPMAREQVLEDALLGYFGALFGTQLPKVDFSTFYAVTYRYQTHRRVAISMVTGITTGSTYKADYYLSRSFYKHTNVTTAFETKFRYADWPMFSLYAITGLGIHLTKVRNEVLQNSEIFALPTCQLTPLGMRFGRNLGGFVEIGYGYKGIVNVGLSARF